MSAYSQSCESVVCHWSRLLVCPSILLCCLEIDRRQRFSFVEFDTDAAAQKAVDAENGRDFNGINLSEYYLSLL